MDAKKDTESLDDRAQALIEREVMANQTGLVEALFDAAIIERDDITNYYRPLPDTTDELLEWWAWASPR